MEDDSKNRSEVECLSSAMSKKDSTHHMQRSCYKWRDRI